MSSQQPISFRFTDCVLYDRTGTNIRGSHWCSRDGPGGRSYHYNNLDGSAYARYSDGSAIFVSRSGWITFYHQGRVSGRRRMGD